MVLDTEVAPSPYLMLGVIVHCSPSFFCFLGIIPSSQQRWPNCFFLSVPVPECRTLEYFFLSVPVPKCRMLEYFFLSVPVPECRMMECRTCDNVGGMWSVVHGVWRILRVSPI